MKANVKIKVRNAKQKTGWEGSPLNMLKGTWNPLVGHKLPPEITSMSVQSLLHHICSFVRQYIKNFLCLIHLCTPSAKHSAWYKVNVKKKLKLLKRWVLSLNFLGKNKALNTKMDIDIFWLIFKELTLLLHSSWAL